MIVINRLISTCIILMCLFGCAYKVTEIPIDINVPHETASPDVITNATTEVQYLCSSDEDCIASEYNCYKSIRCFHKDEQVNFQYTTPNKFCSAMSSAAGCQQFHRDYDIHCICNSNHKCMETRNSTIACEKLYVLAKGGCIQNRGGNCVLAVWRGLLDFKCPLDVCNMSTMVCSHYGLCNLTFEQVLNESYLVELYNRQIQTAEKSTQFNNCVEYTNQSLCENQSCTWIDSHCLHKCGTPSDGCSKSLIRCCEGFKQVTLYNETDGACNANLCGTVCIRCGDSVCDQYESSCNCPQDCGEKELCFDPDGGLNYWTQSKSQSKNRFANDRCGINNDSANYCDGPECTLAEGYCTGKYAQMVSQIHCEYGCYEGHCLLNASDNPRSCLDSDGGNNLFVRGSIRNRNISDFCSNETMLVEYLCENERVQNLTHACSCSEGRCMGSLLQTCTDTDGGLNYTVKGRMTLSGQFTHEWEDYCVKNELHEQYCITPSEARQEFYECLNGCSDGQCNP